MIFIYILTKDISLNVLVRKFYTIIRQRLKKFTNDYKYATVN